MKIEKVRRMKVYELAGKSMIRINANYLSEVFGFMPGDEIEVEYCEDGSIRIRHANDKELLPVT